MISVCPAGGSKYLRRLLSTEPCAHATPSENPKRRFSFTSPFGPTASVAWRDGGGQRRSPTAPGGARGGRASTPEPCLSLQPFRRVGNQLMRIGRLEKSKALFVRIQSSTERDLCYSNLFGPVCVEMSKGFQGVKARTQG